MVVVDKNDNQYIKRVLQFMVLVCTQKADECRKKLCVTRGFVTFFLYDLLVGIKLIQVSQNAFHSSEECDIN